MINLKIGFTKMYVASTISLLFLIMSFNLCAQDEPTEKIPNVIIITLVGVSNIDSIEDPSHQYIPNLWNNMFKEGTLYTNLIDLNEQFHIPPVSAIITGKTYENAGANNNKDFKLKAPSIFQYIRKKYNLPAYKLWSIGDWYYGHCIYQTEGYLEDSFPCRLTSKSLDMSPEAKELLTRQELNFLDNFHKFRDEGIIKWPHWDSLGKFLYQIFNKIMRKYKPKFVHYIMNDTESAHSDTFSRYVLSLKQIDKKIFEIWKTIKEDPFYNNNTYLIISPDHERNLYYMQHHESLTDEFSHVWMYIYGPNIKKGVAINRPIHHIDIFATVAYIMAVDTHSTQGKILKDCFHVESDK